jgi:hypothetical protein
VWQRFQFLRGGEQWIDKILQRSEITHLDELAPCLTAQDQTLSYFGFGPADLKQFALNLPARAVDPIVPIGAALDFNTVWDGYNLLQVFTREIDMR